MGNLQIIGIIGYNFCGSTYLSRLLHCFPDVKAGGELHWIFKPFAPYEIKTVAGWPVRRSCVACGPNCKVLTKEFIAQGFPPLQFYPAVARQMRTSILVSADKLPQHFSSFVHPKKLDGIILFKSPIASMWSDIKNERRSPLVALRRWTNLYSSILSWAPGFCGRSVYLSYLDLVNNPDASLRRIKEAFGLVSSPQPSENIDTFRCHLIGGNPGGHQKKGTIVDVDYQRQAQYHDLDKLYRSDQEAVKVFSQLKERAMNR